MKYPDNQIGSAALGRTTQAAMPNVAQEKSPADRLSALVRNNNARLCVMADRLHEALCKMRGPRPEGVQARDAKPHSPGFFSEMDSALSEQADAATALETLIGEIESCF